MKKIMRFMIISFAFLTSLYAVELTNATTFANDGIEYVRVGLDSKFKDQSEIRINNLGVQFSLNGYAANLSSSGDIRIKLSNHYFYKSNDAFINYKDAKHQSDLFNYSNPNTFATVGLASDGFHVFAGNFNSPTEATNAVSTFPNKTLVSSDKNLLEIYNGQNKIVIEGYESFRIGDIAESFMDLNGTKYRGKIGFAVNDKTITAYSYVSVEEYLYSVVPSEMPASWHTEALKAQSVAARSYLLTQSGKHIKRGYDVCDTTHCQVYSGVKNEHEKTTTAVNETAGIVAYFDNEPINAVFFSSSGGITDDSENTWASPVPYLRSVVEVNETEGKVWTRSFTLSELTTIAKTKAPEVGQVTSVEINKITNERVSELLIKGSGGSKVLKGEEVRTFFSSSTGGSLDSRYFRIGNSPAPVGNSTSKVPASENISIAQNPKDESIITQNDNGGKVHVYDGRTNKEIDSSELYVAEPESVTQNNKADLKLTSDGINIVGSSLENPSNIVASNNKNAVADSGRGVTLQGRGWGHGVGLSQYGAKGMAEKGYKFDQILKHYYTGITLR